MAAEPVSSWKKGNDTAPAHDNDEFIRGRGRNIVQRHATGLLESCARPYVAPFSVQRATEESVRSLQEWIIAHPSEDLTVKTLAAYTGFGVRHFIRVFGRVSGMTPGQFVDRARVHAAARLLEDTELLLRQVALRCGFANVDIMRLAFMRTIGITPNLYRMKCLLREEQALARQKYD
jgi:transcriptional regulator GlxA family with amidase domain